MKYISQNANITLKWQVMKGMGNVQEDFSRSTLTLYLRWKGEGGKDQIAVPCSGTDTGLVTATLQTEATALAEGVYGVELIWEKNKETRQIPSLQRTFVNCAFGIQANATGTTVDNATVKITSVASAFGYDGLSTYEIANLQGLNPDNISRNEWCENAHEQSALLALKADKTEMAKKAEYHSTYDETIAYPVGDMVLMDEKLYVVVGQKNISSSKTAPTEGWESLPDLNGDGNISVSDLSVLAEALKNNTFLSLGMKCATWYAMGSMPLVYIENVLRLVDSEDKANKATTLEGYGITDAYTQSYINTLAGELQDSIDDVSSAKADKAHTHAISEVAELQDNLDEIFSQLDDIGENKADGTDLTAEVTRAKAAEVNAQNAANKAITAINDEVTNRQSAITSLKSEMEAAYEALDASIENVTPMDVLCHVDTFSTSGGSGTRTSQLLTEIAEAIEAGKVVMIHFTSDKVSFQAPLAICEGTYSAHAYYYDSSSMKHVLVTLPSDTTFNYMVIG